MDVYTYVTGSEKTHHVSVQILTNLKSHNSVTACKNLHIA